jgi:hypothetical protein
MPLSNPHDTITPQKFDGQQRPAELAWANTMLKIIISSGQGLYKM